jgi:VWFA-related protein
MKHEVLMRPRQTAPERLRPALATALAIVLACPLGLVAQQPIFPSRVDAIAVDVVVVDKNGRPVEGLTQNDFVIREDGSPQKILTFEGVTPRPSDTSRRLRASSNSGTAQTEDRWFFVAFDDANISQFSTQRARGAVAQFIEKALQPGDHLMVAPTAGGASTTGRLPEDVEPLKAFVNQLQGLRRPDTTAGRLWDHEAQAISLGRDRQIFAQVARRYFENNLIPESYPMDREVRDALQVNPGLGLIQAKARQTYTEAISRIRTSLVSLERLAAAFANGRGRKTLVFVSEGFIMDPSIPDFRALIQAARNANVAVHFVDVSAPDGLLGRPGMLGAAAELGANPADQDGTIAMALASREADGTRSIAADTGGTVVTGTRLLDGLERIAAEGRSYYMLGYSPSNQRRDGKFRKISVSVNRPGVEVRARNGYFAAGGNDARARPTKNDDQDRLPVTVRTALDSPFTSGDIPMRLSAYTFGADATGKVQTLLAGEVDLAPLNLKPLVGSVTAKLDSYVLIRDQRGGETQRDERFIDVSMPPAVFEQTLKTGLPVRREFQLLPGQYQLTLVVRDRATGLVGSVRHDVSVPAPDSLRISTPILTDTVARTAAGPGRPLPIARRAFRAGSRLVSAFDVYGPRLSEKISVGYTLRRADRAVVGSAPLQPVPPGPNGSFSAAVGVAVPEDAVGDYELTIVVRDELTGASVEDREWLVVERP